jgi:iron complex transport system permease protein
LATLGVIILLAVSACAVLHLGPRELAGWCSTGHLDVLDRLLIERFRLPRLCMALMVGSGMALSGWTAQRVTRNPLASPDILTVPAAAGLGVTLLLWLSNGKVVASYAIPCAAAGSGILAALLLFSLAGRKRGLDGSGFLLVGIALGALLTAANFLIALNAPQGVSLHQYTVAWMSGQLSRASWDYVWLLLPGWWFLVLAIGMFASRSAILQFENDVVTQLGGRPDRWRRTGLCLSAALCAACIGVGGGFGFIGFIAPHLVRNAAPRAAGSPAMVAVVGALLLLTSDAVGQFIMWPDQVPAGVVIAVLGTPCFVWFLFHRNPLRRA